jgi:hypothetical protein
MGSHGLCELALWEQFAYTSFSEEDIVSIVHTLPDDKRQYIIPKCCVGPGDPSDKSHVGFTECLLPFLRFLFL